MNKENQNINTKNVHYKKSKSIIVLLSVVLFFLFTVSLKFITSFFASEINILPKNTVNIETSDNIKIYNTNNEALEEISLSPDESYRYIVEVDDSYTQNQITSSYTPTDENGQKIESLTQNISPSQVLSNIDSIDSPNETVNYQTFAGAITMQGDQAVYDVDSIKKYWVYDISNISSPGIISVYGADQTNTVTIEIGGNENSGDIGTAKELYDTKDDNGTRLLDVIDRNTNESIIDKSFAVGDYISFKVILNDQFKNSGFEVKLIPQEWVSEGSIKGEHKLDYDYSAPLRPNNSIYSVKLENSSVIWINNIERSEYTVTFDAENVDVQKAGIIKAFSDTTAQEYENLKEIKVAIGQKIMHGQILTFSIDLNETYGEVENLDIKAVVKGNNASKVSITTLESSNKIIWKAEGITSNTTITFQNIELRKINVELKKKSTEESGDPPNLIIGDINANKLSNQDNINIDYGSNFSFTVYPENGYHWKNDESEFTIAVQDNDNLSNKNYKCIKRLDGDIWYIDVRDENGNGLVLPKNTPSSTYKITLTISAKTEKDDEVSVPDQYTANFGGNENINVQEVEYLPTNTAILSGQEVKNISVPIDNNKITVTSSQVTIAQGLTIPIDSSTIIAKCENPIIEGKFTESVNLSTNKAVSEPINIENNKTTFEFSPIVNVNTSDISSSPSKPQMSFKITNSDTITYGTIDNKTFDNISKFIKSIKIKGTIVFNDDNTETITCTADIEFQTVPVTYTLTTSHGTKNINIPITSNISDTQITSYTATEGTNTPNLTLNSGASFQGTVTIESASPEGTNATVTTKFSNDKNTSPNITFKTSRNIPITVNDTDENKTETKTFDFTSTINNSDLTANANQDATATITPGTNEIFSPKEHSFKIPQDTTVSGTISGKVARTSTTTTTGSGESQTTVTTITYKVTSCTATLNFTDLELSTEYSTKENSNSTLDIGQHNNIESTNANDKVSVTNSTLTINTGTSFEISKNNPISSYVGDPSKNEPTSITANLSENVSIATRKNITIANISPPDFKFEKLYSTSNEIDEFFGISGSSTPSVKFTINGQDNIFYSQIEDQTFNINNISQIRIHGTLSSDSSKCETCYVDITFIDLTVTYSTLKILNSENNGGTINNLNFDSANDTAKYVLITPKEESGLSNISLELLSGDMSIENSNLENIFSISGKVFILSNVKDHCNILKSADSDNYLYFKSTDHDNLDDLVEIKYKLDSDTTENWKTYSFDSTWGINSKPSTSEDKYQFKIQSKGTNSIENVIVTVPTSANIQLQPDSDSTDNDKEKLYQTTQKSQITIININNIETMTYKITIPNKEGLIFKNASNGDKLSGIISTKESISILLEAETGYYFPTKYDEDKLLFNILTISNNSENEKPVAQMQNIGIMSTNEITGYRINIYNINNDVELSFKEYTKDGENFDLTPIKLSCKVYLISPDEKIVFKGISGYDGEKVDDEGNPIEQEIPIENNDYILVTYGQELKFTIDNKLEQDITVQSGLINSLKDLSPIEDVYRLKVSVDNTVIKVEKLPLDSYRVNFELENKDIIITEAVKVQSTDAMDITSISIPVTQGEDLEFRVIPLGKYSQSIPVAKVSNKPISNTVEEGGIKFTLKDVQEDTTVTISDIIINSYDVTFDSAHLTFYETNTGERLNGRGSIVKHGNSLKFYIVPRDGHNIKSANFEISPIDENIQKPTSEIVTINQNQGQYEIKNIQEAIVVKGTAELDQYSLSFQKDIDANNEQKFKAIQSLKENFTDLTIQSKAQISIPSITLPENTSSFSTFTKTIINEGDTKISDYFEIVNPPSIETSSGNSYTISINDISSIDISGTIKKSDDGSYSISSCKANIKFNEKINGNIEINSLNSAYDIILNEKITLDTDNTTVIISPDVQIKTNTNINQDITSIGKVLGYGEIFTFNVELNSKYNKSEINISLSNPDQGRILDLSSDGVYKYQIQIYSNNMVTVNNISLNNYSLSLKQSDSVMESLEIYDSTKNNLLNPQNNFSVVHANTYSFTVKVKYGFEISSTSVFIGPADSDITTEKEKFTKLISSIDGEYYIYTTPKIIEDSKIVMNALERKEYSVGFKGQFVIFKKIDDSEIKEEQKVKHGDAYSFKLYPEDGYNLNKITVATNTGSKITLKESNDKYNLYNIESVRENLVVIVSGSRRNEYQIIFEKGNVKSSDSNLDTISLNEILSIHEESGNILKSDSDPNKMYGTALHGYDYKFNISLDDKFNRSNIVLITKIASNDSQEGPENGADPTVPPDEDGNGYWTLPGKYITGKQITITIEDIKVNQYTIGFSGEGISFKNSDGNFVSEWNENENEQQLTSKAPTIEHTLDDMSNISNAHAYQIEIIPRDDLGYSLDENLRVYLSNGTITRDTKKPTQWVYNMTNVTNDTVVYVEGVKSILYLVKFTDQGSSSQRFKVYNENDKNITSGVRLAHGENLKFKIALNDAYTQSIIDVYYDKNGNGELSDDEKIAVKNGFYEFENVTKNSDIIITNISTNKYNITFNQDARITFKNASGNIINSNDNIEVNHGAKYSFNVESNTGYNLGSAFISATNATAVKDEKNSTDTKLVITLSDIVGTSSVSVNGITINLYSVKFQDKNQNQITNANIYSYPTDRDITSGTQTYFNKELKFKIELKEGYTNSSITVANSLTPNNTINKNDEGYYSITITQDTLININGIEINRYDITLSAEDDLTIKEVNFSKVGGSEAIIPLPYEGVTTLKGVVEHGANYSFLATANKGFTLSDLKVNVSGSDVEIKVDTKSGQSQATITLIGVTKNLSVENDPTTGLSTYENPVRISNTKKQKYVVSFSGSEMNNVTILDKESLKDITRSGKEVLYGSSLTIIANASTGYDQSIANWVFTGTDSDHNNVTIEKLDTNVWQIKNVSNDVTVTLSGVTLNTYEMTFIGPDVEFKDRVTGNDISSQNPSVTHGSYFTFKVVAKEGFDLEGATISTTAGKLTEENKAPKEAIYTLSEIDSPPTIEVKVLKSNINIKLIESEGIVYHEPFGTTILTGIQTRPYGDTFSFSVKPEYGYKLSSLKVKFGDTLLEPANVSDESGFYRYETPPVKEDTDITATISKETYKINLPTPEKSEGIKFYENNKEINSSTLIQIEYGGKFQFTTKLDDKHNQSSVTIKANDETVNFINGYYTISEISTDISITVEGLEINRYKVNLSESTGAQYENVSTEMSNISGVYIIPYGSEISFGISAKTGYELSQMVVVCKEDNGTAISLEPKDGKYTIKNITSNKTVSVQNAKEVQYKVSFEPTNGVTYKNDQGLVVTDPVSVTHGSNFEFQVSISDEYDDSVPVVKTTSSTIGAQKLSAGKYMLSDVTEDLTIQVLNVSKNKYTVTLTKITGIVYKDESGKTLESESQKVEYNDDFKFQVFIQPAYNDSVITVMLGKDNMATENGVYIIRGIKEDKTVTVTGITENEETLLINTITKLNDKVESSTDVDAIIQATKRYNQLSDSKKALISNYDKLQSLQKLAGEYSHITNDIKVSGVPWNIKLVAVTLSTNADACSRIYDKLSSEFILSLYDIYLVDMLTGQKYELPEGEKVIVTIPTPDLKYFKDPLIVHEVSSTGKIEYLIMSINGDTSSFEMTSFSAVGVAAKKSLNSGNSSLFNTIGDGINNIRDMITNMVNGGGSGQNSNMSNGSGSGSSSSSGSGNDSWDDSVQSDGSNSIFGGSTNVTSGSGNTSGSGSNSNSNNSNQNNNGLIGQFVQDGSGIMQGSAIRLILILIFSIVIAILVIIVIKRLYPKNSKKTSNKNSKENSSQTDTKLPPNNKNK